MRRGLEQRYRRTLRMLPGYYRDQWEEDMVAAFLDGFLTGDPDEDEIIMEFARPSWSERASVAALATRLYLGGQGTPRRYFAWGQAVRRAVLIVMLGQAILALGSLVYLTWLHHRLGWFPAPPTPQLAHVSAVPAGSPPPQSPAPTSQVPLPGDMWSTVWYAVGYAWVVVYIELVLGYYRTAQLIAVLAVVPNLIYLVQLHVTYHQPLQLRPPCHRPREIFAQADRPRVVNRHDRQRADRFRPVRIQPVRPCGLTPASCWGPLVA